MKLSKLADSKYIPIYVAVAIFAVTFLIYYSTSPGDAAVKFTKRDYYNYFVWLADAFLNGRFHLEEALPNLRELVTFNGKFYIIYPPMPAILLIPFVAIWGTSFSQDLASLIIGSANVSLIYLIMRRLTHDSRIQIWITLLFGFSTVNWWLATMNGPWYFAHVTSFLFLSLAIYETFTNQRLFLIGLLIGASYWTRLNTILCLPFFMIMLSDKWLLESAKDSMLKRIDLKPLVQLGLGVGIFVLLNFSYNFLRFGTPFDIAYTLLETPNPFFTEGAFSLSYIPAHLYVLFVKGPVVMNESPYIVPSVWGMSILITTPAIIYSIFGGIRNKLSLACWLGILPVALLLFVKGGTGWPQFGYRYAMDFLPFWILLTFKGIGSEVRWDHKTLLCMGIICNIWGVIFINKFAWFEWW
jgi:hypothetical protein